MKHSHLDIYLVVQPLNLMPRARRTVNKKSSSELDSNAYTTFVPAKKFCHYDLHSYKDGLLAIYRLVSVSKFFSSIHAVLKTANMGPQPLLSRADGWHHLVNFFAGRATATRKWDELQYLIYHIAGIANHDASNVDMEYTRSFTLPPTWKGQHVLLHFDAVDHTATVYLNGHKLGSHSGG